MIQGFSPKDILQVDRALEIAEDAACNHYHISGSNWKKYGFEVSHLAHLQQEEITDQGLAQISRYVFAPYQWMPASCLRDYYRVCLQDHNILKVVERGEGLELFPLMIYILTHELVHIIRFRKFFQRFDVSSEEREIEESKVHSTTFDILRPIKKIDLKPIFDSYVGHRYPNAGSGSHTRM